MNDVISSWGRAIRRVLCCGPGANDEPVYESLGHQAHDAATLQVMGEWVEELRGLMAPIADVPERMRRLELSLHPLLVYRPEDGEYVDMTNGLRPALRPAPAAPPPDPPARSVWLAWLQERVDYGEPW